ncbi:hypothetical protein BU15DRAFT_68029 [Melanogaster broomeanus]|nr:hypothetical protein BU15DRAFT_68029 [Melanogaster broomeanus]
MLTKQDYTETGLRLSPGPGMRGCGRRWVGLTGFELNPIILYAKKMPSASNSITPAPSMPGVDWARLKTPELGSDIEDNDEVAMAKAKERRRRKVEKKRREDEEKRLREEEEKRRREEEDRRRREEEEKRRQEEETEADRKREEELMRDARERLTKMLLEQKEAGEVNKKRQREEVEAGPSVAREFGTCCLRCARAGVPCEFTNDGNKRRTACDRCAAQREKCQWPEMHAPGAGKGKAKAKEVPTSPRQGEKKKRVRKAKVQDDDEVEIVGERMSGAGPSRISLDRLVMAIEGMSDRMSELTQAHRESTEAQRESSRVSRRVARALEDLVDEAACIGAPEEFAEEESEEEEVAEGELDEEMAGLQEDMAENPMSPPKKLGN